MATVTGSVMSAFRPYLSDRLPTMGVTTSAPSPVTCIGRPERRAPVSWILASAARTEANVAANAHCVLEAAEVDGDGALVAAGADGLHGDVGDRRDHHEGGEVEQEGHHEQVPQPRQVLHLC